MFYVEVIDIIDKVIACCVALLLVIFYFIRIKKPSVTITLSFILAAYLVTAFLNMEYASNILLIIFILIAIIFSFINIASFRSMFFDFTFKNKKKKEDVNRKLSNEEIYKIIDDTIKVLSKSKTGALLTFEKKDDLTDITKNGTNINTPITKEIIQTIFYPGTRLHDGAIVIRGDIIIAASVYYTPTTQALTGKYGSRHRAALGISEITDSVTIVVSEETGRISIAYQGKLIPVAQDEFLDEFVSYMEK